MKHKIIALLLAGSFLAAGCQQKSPVDPSSHSAWECTQDTTTIRLENKDDTLNTSEQIFIIPYSAIETEEGTDVEAARKEALEVCSRMFSGIDGVTFICKALDTGIQADLKIDYSKASIDQLKKASLTDQLGLEEGYVSLSKTIGKMEEQGFACIGVTK